MDRQTLNFKTVGAHCPHCRTSFLEKGKIVNYFRRPSSGEIGKVMASIIAGDYTKEIKKEFGEDLVLEENEKVEFFCQYCAADLNFKFNDNLFLMNIETETGEIIEVVRSARYKEEFTAVIKDKRKYYYGDMSEEQQVAMEKTLEQMHEHYSNGFTLAP